MTESSKRRHLYEAVMSHPPMERRAALERLCAGLPELRDEVWAMVLASDRSSGTSGDPVAVIVRAANEALREAKPGDRVGGYRLVEPIGEGGFGDVWSAQQGGELKRLVAVKILKPGMDSRQVVARFEQERQALALMEHPHIARVFDAGTTADGRPFFAMELVKGLSITEYCAAHGLDLEARLEVFSQVCHAVQHAHAKGVIHRDIKPRNVLVETHDGRPCAKVIDFGIAKALGQTLTDKSIFTAHAAMVGTLEYMSPEQADGDLDVDIRSDVYSLGALLYELLTGEPPVTARELQELGLAGLLEALREREPERPSVRISKLGTAAWRRGATVEGVRRSDAALAGILARDLDWVVMKALEKDRGRRYPTADALAEDLRRYRDGEAVVAVPPSVGYRLRKFARRRRHGLIAATAVAVVSAIWLGVYLRAEGQRSIAERLQVASEATQKAERAAGELMSYTLMLSSASQSSVGGDREVAQHQLAEASVAFRDWEWNYVSTRVENMPRPLSSWCESLALSRCGSFAAGLANDGIRIYACDSGSLLSVIELPTSVPENDDYEWLPRRSGASPSKLAFLEDGNGVFVYQEEWGVDEEARCGVVWWRQLAEVLQPTRWDCLLLGEVEPWVDSLHGLVVYIDQGGRLVCADLETGIARWTVEQATPDGCVLMACGDDLMVIVGGRLVSRKIASGELNWDVEISSFEFDGGAILSRNVKPDVVAYSESTQTIALLAEVPVYGVYDGFVGMQYSVASGDVGRVMSGMDVESMLQDYENAFRAGGRRRCGFGEVVRWRQRDVGDLRVHAMLVGEQDRDRSSIQQGDLAVLALREWGEVRFFGLWNNGDRRSLSLISGELLGVNENPSCPPKELVIGGPWAGCVPRYAAEDGSSFWRGHRRATGKPIIWAQLPPSYCPGDPLARCLSVAFKTGASVIATYSDCWVTFDPYTGVRLVTDDLTPIPRRSAGSEGGRHLVVDTAEGLHFVSVDPERAVPLAAVDGNVFAVAVTDHGPRCAAIVLPRDRGASLVEWGADGALVSRRPVPADEVLEDSVLALANGRVALGTRSGRLLLWNANDATPSHTAAWSGAAVHSLAFSRDGATLAVGLSDGSIATVDTASGRELRRFSVHIGPVRALAWSASNRRLFSAGEDRFVRVLEPSSGRMVLDLGNAAIPGEPTRRYYDGRATCLLATPDGERLIAGFDDGAIRVWDAVPWKQRYAELQARKR